MFGDMSRGGGGGVTGGTPVEGVAENAAGVWSEGGAPPLKNKKSKKMRKFLTFFANFCQNVIFVAIIMVEVKEF